MDTIIITQLTKHFEDEVHIENDIEFWYARDLQKLLGYTEWRKFSGVIEKAKESCEKTNNSVLDHFVGADNMVQLGSGAKKIIPDIKLTRYACYLIAKMEILENKKLHLHKIILQFKQGNKN